MTTITMKQAAEMIENSNDGHMFSVKFVKRTDGSVRDMNCRKGVKKFTNGGSLAFDPKKKNLVCVWEANTQNPEKAYRMISLDSLLEVKMNGSVFSVKG